MSSSKDMSAVYNDISEEIVQYLENIGRWSGFKQTDLIESLDADCCDKLSVKKRDELYSVAFYGFDDKKSSAFASRSNDGRTINDKKIYRDVSKSIAQSIFDGTNSCFKYYINDESWLLAKLREAYDGKNIGEVIGLPEVIVVPHDVSFSDEVTKLLRLSGITVQRISVNQHSDSQVLSLDSQIRYNDNVGEQVFIKSEDGYKNAIMQLEFEAKKKKILKYRFLYNEIFAQINEKLSESISKEVDGFDLNRGLFVRNANGSTYQINDLDYIANLNLSPGEFIVDGNGKKIDFDSIYKVVGALKKKQDELMNRIIELYKEKDITTYYHIMGMINLIGKLNNGLSSTEKLNDVEIEKIRKMAILHDIGKLVIPNPILNKPGKLDGDDKDIMDSHVYLENVTLVMDPFIKSLVTSALLHHRGKDKDVGNADKKLDDLQKDKYADIITVLDVVEALTTDKRPYRKGAVEDKVLYSDIDLKIDKEIIEYKYACALLSQMGYDVTKIHKKGSDDSIGNNAISFETTEERRMGK